MTVNVGVMELPVTEDPDPVRTYLNGTHPSGGLWTALTRASNHDHSGGLSGVQLGATSIPDGSITAAKLDPAVLGPYALTDGSKPFTGQVSMNADAIVRDTLFFGARPAGVADASLKRAGAGALRVDTHLGVGGNPAAWGANYRALHLGQDTVLWANAASDGGAFGQNTYHDGTNFRAIVAGNAASYFLLAGGTAQLVTAPAVAAGATQAFTTRLGVNTFGTVALTVDAGQPHLASGTGQRLTFSTPGIVVGPLTDNTTYSGFSDARWLGGYTVAGFTVGSSAELKEDLTPLDPAACYQAAKDVRWYDFTYRPPTYQEPEPPPDSAYDATDDNDTKAAKKALRDEAGAQARAAHARVVVESAPARHQRGFVFPTDAEAKDDLGGTLPPVPDLFGLSDRQSTTPQADLATLGCALQEVIRRLESLEAAA